MLLVWLYSLIVLAILMGAQIRRPRLLLKLSKRAYLISIILVFFVAAYLTYQQYRVFQASPVGQLLLPPRQPISYYLRYSFTHFFLNPLLALAVSGLGWLGIRLLNRRVGERFFERPEAYLFAVSIFLNGHPQWIFYAISVFSVAVLFSVVKFVFTRSRDVIFSFYYFWLPVAILVILISTWFRFPFSS